MTKTTMPDNRVVRHSARAEIETRVEMFRQHQARLQAERERRWTRIMAEARDTLSGRNSPGSLETR